MQTVNIDGQEALFIPSSAISGAGGHHAQAAMQFATSGGQQVQLASQQVQLANGQIITPQPVSLIRAPSVFPTSIIQNIGGQTVQLPTGLFCFVFFFYINYYYYFIMLVSQPRFLSICLYKLLFLCVFSY